MSLWQVRRETVQAITKALVLREELCRRVLLDPWWSNGPAGVVGGSGEGEAAGALGPRLAAAAWATLRAALSLAEDEPTLLRALIEDEAKLRKDMTGVLRRSPSPYFDHFVGPARHFYHAGL